MGWALHTQGGSRAWNSIQIWAGTTHTEPQHSPCVIPTDRTGSRIQSQLWKWFIIHARSTAVTYSTCPRPQDCVCSSRPCPAHQAHKSQTALGSSKDGDSPGKGVLIMSNFWIFTRNKWKLYKLDSLTQWDLMCRYCQLWRIKSPNFFFFFPLFSPSILFRIHFFSASCLQTYKINSSISYTKEDLIWLCTIHKNISLKIWFTKYFIWLLKWKI